MPDLTKHLILPAISAIIGTVLLIIYFYYNLSSTKYLNGIFSILIGLSFGITGSSISNYIQTKMLYETRSDLLDSIPVNEMSTMLDKRSDDINELSKTD